MRGAPPVQMAVGRDARWGAFCLVLSALAGATAAVWAVMALHMPGPAAVPAALFGICSAGVLMRPVILTGPSGLLAWDGQRWALRGRPGEVDVMLDLGGWMLLRVHCADGGTWVPLALPRDGRSALFRAALHAHAGRAAAPALGQSDDDG